MLRNTNVFVGPNTKSSNVDDSLMYFYHFIDRITIKDLCIVSCYKILIDLS